MRDGNVPPRYIRIISCGADVLGAEIAPTGNTEGGRQKKRASPVNKMGQNAMNKYAHDQRLRKLQRRRVLHQPMNRTIDKHRRKPPDISRS